MIQVLSLHSLPVFNTGPLVTVERLELHGCSFNFGWLVWVYNDRQAPISQIKDSCSSCEACKMQIGSFSSDAHPAVVVIFFFSFFWEILPMVLFFFFFPFLLAIAHLSFSKGDFLWENSGN